MNTISVQNLQKQLDTHLEQAQTARVVVTRKGKLSALIVGLEGIDWNTLVLESDAEFWKMIQKRRKQRTVPLAKVKEQLGIVTKNGKGKRLR